MRLRFAVAALLLVGGCADRGRTTDEESWALESATPLAAPVDCIQRSRISGETVRGDRIIDFTLDDGRVVRNRLPMQCRGLAEARRFVHRTGLERLCSTDTISVIEADGRTGAACGLGMFQEIAIPPRPAPLR